MLCIPCLCEKLHADNAEPRRRFAKLCSFAWETYALLSRIISHRTHRNPQNLLRIFLRHKHKRTYFIFTQNSRTYTEFAPPFFRHKNTRAYFIFRQNSRKYTEFAPHASAKVCAVCVRQIRSEGILCLPWIPVWKNLTQRRKGREALCTFVLMSKILHADNAEPRRRLAKLCAFAWETYALLSRIISHRAHRLTQNLLRIFWDISTKEHILFSHRNSRKYTEFALHASAKVCAVCVRQIRSEGILCLPWIPVWKNLTQRRKGREALCTFVLMSKILHADCAEPRRRFAKLCAFAWEIDSYVKNHCTQSSQTDTEFASPFF